MSKLLDVKAAAEDIGKLPDISIADSLTRLSGLTTQRLNGRAQAIVIRGMNGEADPLYDEAIKIVTESRRASISGVPK